MLFFTNKPTAIVYLRRQDIVFINKKTSVRLDIPVDLVQNLEVNDGAKLSELIAGLLDRQECRRQQVLFALDPSVVFQKDVPAKGLGDLSLQATDFEQKLPFDAANRQSIVIAKKDKVSFFGTNKRLLQAVVQGVQKANKVRAVLPATLYGISDSKSVDRKIITALFSDTAPLKQPSFQTKV